MPSTTKLESGVPFLRSIPILGWLFRASEDIQIATHLLAQQILAGAPADVFLPAGAAPMERVEEAGLLGATAFVEHHPWAADVMGFVNLEARGSGVR